MGKIVNNEKVVNKYNTCGTFLCKIEPDGTFEIFKDHIKNIILNDNKRRTAITELVNELISLPEPGMTGKEHFKSTLTIVCITENINGYSVRIRYNHEDGEKHPVSKYDSQAYAYSIDEIGGDGKLYHCYSSFSGPNYYENKKVNSMDELYAESPFYQALRKRYEKIRLFAHEYSFWEDESYLFE